MTTPPQPAHPGSVYLLHLEPGRRVTGNRVARHYLGFAERDVDARIAQHLRRQGSPLVAAVLAAGGSVTLERTWTDVDRAFERRLKRRHETPRLCPRCTRAGLTGGRGPLSPAPTPCNRLTITSDEPPAAAVALPKAPRTELVLPQHVRCEDLQRTPVADTAPAGRPPSARNPHPHDRRPPHGVHPPPRHRAPGREFLERRPPRRRMPIERRSLTHKFCIDGHEGYLTAGLYDDGTVGELFISDVGKEGSTLRGVFSAWATTLSIALQHGVPLRVAGAQVRLHAL